MTTRKLTSHAIAKPATTYVGRRGEIFYDTATATLRLSNGATAGGISFSVGAPASSLVNGSYTVALGGDGTLTLPSGGAVDGNFVNGQWLDVWLTAPEGATKTAGVRDFFGKTVAVANENYFLIETNRAISTKSWTFGPTGVLTLPNSAVIKDTAYNAVAFGLDAGQTTQGENAVAIGYLAGNSSQGVYTVAIGNAAGQTSQGTESVAIGSTAGRDTQGSFSVAVGLNAGRTSQGSTAVALGYNAGLTSQGQSAVAIGYLAGYTNQAANTIILNASGVAVNGVSTQTNSFYVAPIRNSGATSAYATKRVLQYNETTKEITYSNTLDAVRAYITGYSSEIHVSPVAADDTGNGTIGDPVKTIARAQALAALAFETTGAGQRKTIVLHPGDYVEDVTISTQYTVLTTHELIGKNTTLSGTLTITKGCTIDGLKMANLVISATSAFGSVDIIGCTVTTATTKTSAAYTTFRGCDLSSATLSITGSGTTALIGGNYFTLTVNNAAAGVLAKTIISMGPVTLTAGTLQLSDTLIYSATNTSYAITQSAYSVLTINNCQTLIPDLSNVSRISLNGFYSILSAVYDKPNSILATLSATGGSLSSIIYDQYINADRLILSTGGQITFPDATTQTTAWPSSSGTKASSATGTLGQISWDANYIYVCTATNTWKRSPLTGAY
jgi:hypothetical protein